MVTAVMRSRNFLDAAQAEKMREREAMENVKLLYHDNMIEMTGVSTVVWTLLSSHYVIEHYHHILSAYIISFVTTINTMHCSHDHIVVDTISLFKCENKICQMISFNTVGEAITDRWCDVIG